MRSFAEQIRRIRTAKYTTLLSDVAAQELLWGAMERYLDGERNDRQIRFDVENIIRDAYRDSARAAQDTMRWQAGRNRRWAPVPKNILTATLRNLLKDVRRNLQEFKDSERDEKALRKAVLRFRLSATVAAQKGFSDGQRFSALTLLEEGVEVRKIWSANFVGNTPCAACTALHGAEVGVHEEFPVYESQRVYGDLYGPPMHPQCRCDAIYLVVENGNRDDPVDLGSATEPKMIESTTVKNLPLTIFRAVIGALGRALDLLRKAALR